MLDSRSWSEYVVGRWAKRCIVLRGHRSRRGPSCSGVLSRSTAWPQRGRDAMRLRLPPSAKLVASHRAESLTTSFETVASLCLFKLHTQAPPYTRLVASVRQGRDRCQQFVAEDRAEPARMTAIPLGTCLHVSTHDQGTLWVVLYLVYSSFHDNIPLLSFGLRRLRHEIGLPAQFHSGLGTPCERCIEPKRRAPEGCCTKARRFVAQVLPPTVGDVECHLDDWFSRGRFILSSQDTW